MLQRQMAHLACLSGIQPIVKRAETYELALWLRRSRVRAPSVTLLVNSLSQNTYRIQLPHRTGQLATVAGTIAEGGGFIGDVTTINVCREHSICEITVEVQDREQAERIAEMIGSLNGFNVFWTSTHGRDGSDARVSA
jgi:hypothetical protein